MAKRIHIHVHDAGWDEGKHKRGSGGQFSSSGGSGRSTPSKGSPGALDRINRIRAANGKRPEKSSRPRVSDEPYVDHRELGKQGKIRQRGLAIGNHIDYYDRDGNKQYGKITGVSNTGITINGSVKLQYG